MKTGVKAMKTNKRQNKGFTIMEMLIVVAVIAVLAAIAIPVFSSSLHKSKVAADIANVRAYYAELQTEYILTGEYRAAISDDMWTSVTDTITHSDGTQTKLQAGRFSVIRTTEEAHGQEAGYQIHYFCNKGDHTQTFGANDKTGN